MYQLVHVKKKTYKDYKEDIYFATIFLVFINFLESRLLQNFNLDLTQVMFYCFLKDILRNTKSTKVIMITY